MATPLHARRRPPAAWRITLGIVVWLLRHLTGWRWKVALPERPIPRDTPLVVAFNHTSNIDAFIVADSVWRRGRRWCQPLAKAELFDVPGLGALARSAAAIPVLRSDDAGRERAFDTAVDRLADGATVMIAPEGTITHDGNLLPLRHGAARMALRAGADILVVTHFGAQRAFSPVARFPHRDVQVLVGMDLLSPWPDEDESLLTGRIAATMLDRMDALQAQHPEPEPDAPWWPPYATPAAPTVTARENLEKYRASMADTVAQARVRMAAFAEEHELEQRARDAREAAKARTESLVSRARASARQRLEDRRTRRAG